MLTAKDIMTTDVFALAPDTGVAEAARLLIERGVNGAPVVADGMLVGILTQSDLVAQQKKLKLPSVFTILDGFIPLGSTKSFERELEKISAMTVAQAMTEDVVSVEADTALDEIATIMVDRRLHTLPVVDQGRLVGIIGKADVLRTLLESKS